MIYNRFNCYRELPTETKQFIRTSGYTTIITNMISSMFDIEGMTITEKYLLMSILLNHGLAYVEKSDNGKLIIIPVQYVGVPNANEVYPSHIVGVKATNKGTIKIDGDISDLSGDVVYCFPDRLGIDEIQRFAYQFAEIDTSLVNNIQFSRIAPLVSSPYANIRKSYEDAVKRMMNGELINSIMSVNSVVEGESKSVDKVDISDGDYSEKIQYLSMYHTQMISRLANLFGIQYNFISKQANITNDELNSNESFCAIYPLMMKDLLEESFRNLNAKIGTNITIKFSRAWAHLNKIDLDPVSEQDENESEILENDNTKNID